MHPTSPRSDDRTSEPVEKDPELVMFGSRLRELREEATLTQEALADASDVHWTFVGQVERGERNLALRNILKLARGLGVPASSLFKPFS